MGATIVTRHALTVVVAAVVATIVTAHGVMHPGGIARAGIMHVTTSGRRRLDGKQNEQDGGKNPHEGQHSHTANKNQ